MGISPKHIYVELDGRLYDYCSGKMHGLSDLSDVSGEGILITEFPGSISRVMEVGTSPKFADVMARRRIEEEGEFDQPISIVAHWKRKRASNSTQIFLTAVPHHNYEQYMTHLQEVQEPIILYPLYGVLHQAVKHYGNKGPVAVVFQHGNVADLLIGSSKRVFSANRSVAFDETSAQVEALWDMVLSDIKAAEVKNKIKVQRVILVSWIDTQPPKWPGDLVFHVDSAKEETLEVEGQTYRASLFGLIRRLPVGASISRGMEKWMFRARRAIMPLNLIILLASALAFSGNWYLSNKVEALQIRYQQMARDLSSVGELRSRIQMPPQSADKVAFVKRLHRAARLPSYKALINDLADAFGNQMTADLLDANYGKSELKAEVRGHIKSPFESAHKAYQQSKTILRKKGYEITESSFSTSINESRFVLRLSKLVK